MIRHCPNHIDSNANDKNLIIDNSQIPRMWKLSDNRPSRLPSPFSTDSIESKKSIEAIDSKPSIPLRPPTCNFSLNNTTQKITSSNNINNTINKKNGKVKSTESPDIIATANNIEKHNNITSTTNIETQSVQVEGRPTYLTYNLKEGCEPNNDFELMSGPLKREITVSKLKGEDFGIGMAGIDGHTYVVFVKSAHYIDRALFPEESGQDYDFRDEASSGSSPFIFCDPEDDEESDQEVDESDNLFGPSSFLMNSKTTKFDHDDLVDTYSGFYHSSAMSCQAYRQTPAYKCGLSFGDQIVTVNHIATKSLDIRNILSILKSSEQVTLEIINAKYVSVKREDCRSFPNPESQKSQCITDSEKPKVPQRYRHYYQTPLLVSENPRNCPSTAARWPNDVEARASQSKDVCQELDDIAEDGNSQNPGCENYLKSKPKNMTLSEWKEIFFETLGFEIENKIVTSVAPNSFASLYGLRVDDAIVGVEGQCCLNYSDDQILNLIRNHLRKNNGFGSEILLSVIPKRVCSLLTFAWSSLGLPEYAVDKIPFVSSSVVHCYNDSTSKKRQRKLFQKLL
eukprot:Awhi_evm1s7385